MKNIVILLLLITILAALPLKEGREGKENSLKQPTKSVTNLELFFWRFIIYIIGLVAAPLESRGSVFNCVKMGRNWFKTIQRLKYKRKIF